MKLTNLKEAQQRAVLNALGHKLIDASNDDDAQTVEAHLDTLQNGYLDVLGPEDFFGTEGWEHWLDLDE